MRYRRRHTQRVADQPFPIPADMEAAIREIVPFVCAGLAAPAGR
jgi:hypothetical protein